MSPNEALALVESATKQKVQLDSLIKSATESFRLIEPWSQATSSNSAIVPIIEGVKAQALVYYRALDMSLKTAEDGYAFSQDSELLCDFLLDPNNTEDELVEFIQDMRAIAQRSHKDANEMSELFRSVRMGLNQIAKNIPSEVAKQEEKEQRAREQMAIAGRRRDASKLIGGTAAAGAAVIGAGVAFGMAFPPGIIILPVILPIFMLISQVMEVKFSNEVSRRETEARSCTDAMKLLHQAASDLSLLVQHVDMFADWWLEMDTMLGAIETKVDQLQAGRVATLRVKSIKRSWTEVKGSYLDYRKKVSKLQDLYPSSRPETSNVHCYLGETAQRRRLAITNS